MKSYSSADYYVVGGGGNNVVYRSKAGISESVIRKPNVESDADKTLKNWNALQKASIPTLKSMELCMLDDKKALLCEDLNSGLTVVYVSPNSVETDEERKKREILNSFYKKKDDHIENQMEQDCYKNHKFDSINNLNSFLDNVKADLKNAEENCIYIDWDAYFFGYDKNKKCVDLSYKIADFDNIIIDLKVDCLYGKLVKSFKESFNNFIQYYMTGSNKSIVLKKLESYTW